MRIVVLGILGRTPVGGVAWQTMHYLEGFRRLGHEVYYVEDTETWPYNPETGANDCAYLVKYLHQLMTWCDMSDRWAFCDVSQGGRVFGLSEYQLSELFRGAEIIINLTGSTQLRDLHFQVPVRAYLETDPCVPQIRVARNDLPTIEFLRAHTHLFTYGENLGSPDCGLPVALFRYYPTRQPIILDWWNSDECSSRAGNLQRSWAFTTIANWQQANNAVEWNGEVYTWSKHLEFFKMLDLPGRICRPIELALACDDNDALQLLESKGWRVADGFAISKDFLTYRDYIWNSGAEFTVAKDQNIRLRSGWFSDRSACYLAAGRPVITQDTGFGKFFPTGKGLFAFKTMEEIVAAVESIDADYEKHSQAARSVAEAYFKAETVLAKMLTDLAS